MAKIKSECPICKKLNVTEVGHVNLKKTRFITLNCGHTYAEKLSITDSESITLKDGKNLWKFQVDGVHFAEKSGFNCLIGDEQGLGKTIQAVALINLHWDELKPILVIVKASLTYQWQKHILLGCERFAQIITSKSEIIPNNNIWIISYDLTHKLAGELNKLNIKTIISDEIQMIKNHEAKRTNGLRSIVNNYVPVKERVIPESEKNAKIKRFEMISKNLMKYHGIASRFNLKIESGMGNKLGLTKCRVTKDGIIVGDISLSKDHILNDKEEDIIDTILHEIAHAITPGAGHVAIWKETSVAIGGNGEAITWCEGTINLDKDKNVEKSVKHKIFLSGTPIKNNAIEYFPALNLLRPEIFPERSSYINTHVGFYLTSKGTYKAAGIKYPEDFKKLTQDFIIRRTRKEVLPDLPSIVRDFQYYEMGEEIAKAYEAGVKKLDKFMKEEDHSAKDWKTKLQGHMMVLYHITGIAKIEPIISYIEEFLENSENGEKLAIFHHHIDVGDLFERRFNDMGIPSVRIVSSYDAVKRTEILDRFRNDKEVRFFIGPTLACGEGIDLEFVKTAILAEREWNPANEEQVEGRFIRATPEAVERSKHGGLSFNISYPVAVGTIDEFFAENGERKRQYVKESLDGVKYANWEESEVMIEIANRMIRKLRGA